MKVLLAVDGSECSDDSVLTALYVAPPFVERAQTVLGPEGVQRAHEHNALEAFHGATALLDQAQVAHETVLQVGDPGPRTARYATEGGYDLVVMGSHGHGALAGLVLGSVVTKVLAICAVPVLVTR